MAAPPTPDLTAILPWAWSLELLSDNPSAPLPLLYGWFKKVQENSAGESFKNARERFALRCLQDVLDSGFDGEADAPDGGTRVDVDLNGSAEDVVRKGIRRHSDTPKLLRTVFLLEDISPIESSALSPFPFPLSCLLYM